MGALINVLKSLFGGILSFVGGLVGGKKSKTVKAAAENVKPIAAKKAKKPKKGKDGFYMEADPDSMEEIPVASVMAAAAVASVDAVEEVASKAGKKGKKDKTAVKAAPAKAPAKAAPVMTPEELIMAAVQPKSVDAAATAAVGTAGFATQYLVPTLTSGRRSPGPSLKMFKTMAKEIRG